MNQQPQERDAFGAREGVNLLYLIALTIAACFWPWLRRGMGSERPGLAGLLALFYMLFYAAATKTPEMYWYLAAWLVMLIQRRAETWRLSRCGVRLHSKATGYPWLAMKVPGVRTVADGFSAEVGLLTLAGGLLSGVSEAWGRFFLLGGVALAIVRITDAHVTRMRVQRMHDAALEQTYLADLYRGKRDEV